MDTIQLPKHVIARAERRWADKLQQDAQVWTSGKPGMSSTVRMVQDGLRSMPVTIKHSRKGPRAVTA
jgi:hypothetical protein